MPNQRQIDVLSDLKTLSDEGDQLAQDCFKSGSIEKWLDACHQVIIKIRDCSSVEDLRVIQYSDSINSFLGIKTKKENSQTDELMGVQVEKIHAKKQVAIPNGVVEDKKFMSAFVSLTRCDEVSVLKGNNATRKEENKDCSSVEDLRVIQYPDTVNSFLGIKAKNENSQPDELMGVQVEKIHAKKQVAIPNEVVEDKKLMSAFVSLTPCDKVSVLKGNDTTRKVENKFMSPLRRTKSDEDSSDETTSLHLSCTKNNPVVLLQQIKTPAYLDGSYVKKTSDDGKSESQFLTKTPVLNRAFNRIANEIDNVDSSQKTKHLKAGNDNGRLTRLESMKNTIAASENDAINAKPTRSGSKRKSSDSKNESNKKQKMNVPETPTFAMNKIVKAKHLLLKKNSSKSALVSTPKRTSKVPTVIVPPAQAKTSRVSKEQHILEEIKKKEDKAKSNIKRVLAERQEKAELSKKNQEEKRQKALEKRMQMQKEKERLRKDSENPAKKAKTREVTENHGKEKKSGVKDNKSLVSNPGKQKHSYVDTACKTPKAEKSDDIESYELTPMPNSSTYNFSDDEDDKPSGKPIPLWAQGVHLKSALIQQFYNSIDPRTIFGSRLDSPDLVQIFKMNKKTYKKRTSSAIWNKLESSFCY